MLYRTNAMSRVIEDTLVRREIAYQVIGGTKFYERAEIKDAIAYLSLLANPFDVVSFTRDRQLAAARARADLARAGRSPTPHARASRCGRPPRAPEQIPGLGAAAVKALRRFMATMGELRERAGLRPRRRACRERGARDADARSASCSRRCSSQTGYLEALEAERTIEAQGRIENLEQLVEVGREFDAAARPAEDDTLDVFLQEIALVADADSRSDDEGLVTLMTLHNAKGLEYPIVFIAGCEDGVFPHSRALDEGGLEEERRLFYVGVTRAMRELYLTYARRRAVFGAHDVRHAQPLPRRDPGRAARRAAGRPASGLGARARAGVRRGRRPARGRGGARRRQRRSWAAREPGDGAGSALPPRRGRRARRLRRGRRHRRGAGRGDRRALRRRRLRAQADGRVRAGQPPLRRALGDRVPASA